MSEAEAWLREMSLEGVILPHTRRIRRNCQDWLVRAESSQAPKIDALALTFDSKEYLITLSRLLPRTGPPNGAKQWRGPNRWREGMSANAPPPQPQPRTPSESVPVNSPNPKKDDKPKPVVSVPQVNPSPRMAQAEEMASLSSMVKVMYEAMIHSGLLRQTEAPGPPSLPLPSSEMELETLGVKRQAESQLQKEAAE